jgi:hypothetical protein
MRHSIDRRDFMKQAATAGIGFGLAGLAAARGSTAAQAVPRRIAANDKIAVAVIGTNGRGDYRKSLFRAHLVRQQPDIDWTRHIPTRLRDPVF